ncbi:MAG TPA: HIT family protein [Myxococcales bacterium]|jgi:histidine triad (HIT) family protein
MAEKCVFCAIASGEAKASVVYQDSETMAFLDSRPLFPGHVLVIPKAHVANLLELPLEKSPALLGAAQKVARGLEAALGCQGSFVALNNKVSQSVPHLHLHIVPRTKGDGLKGFFWPRHPYRDAAHEEEVRSKIASAIQG